MLRLTGDVQRGIGSIRQDINVSVEGGSRQEIKGVQELQLLDKIVELEGLRQTNLLKIRDELRGRKVTLNKPRYVDVTAQLTGSRSSLVQGAIKRGQRALCLPAPGFEGLLGLEIVPGRRFGRELADRARAWAGVGGVIHSDELPAYGIEEAECASIRDACGLRPESAFVMVLAEEARAVRALEAVHDRLREAISGVPSETRRVNEDGTTSYLRPLPGAARMYPETDLPPIVINESMLERARKELPPTPSELRKKLVGLGLSEHVALQLLRSPKLELFESAISGGADPTLSASAILTMLPNLRRDGIDVDSIEEQELAKGLAGFCKLRLPKESLEPFLRELAVKRDAELVLKALQAPGITEAEARAIIRQIVAEKANFVKERGRDSIEPLMGLAMEKLRGAFPGNEVHRILEEEVEAIL
jgi:glutamyl-tRNA(Gln) amidotransferase subunit E